MTWWLPTQSQLSFGGQLGALSYAEELGKLPAKQVKSRLGKDLILFTKQYHFTYDDKEEENLDTVGVAMSKLSLDKDSQLPCQQ